MKVDEIKCSISTPPHLFHSQYDNSNSPLKFKETLLSRGISVQNTQTYIDLAENMIYEAVKLSDVKAVNLASHFFPNSVNQHEPNTGKTPLYIAMERGDLEIIKALLYAKADPNVHSLENLNESPLILAFTKMHNASVDQKKKWEGHLESAVFLVLLAKFGI